MIEIIAKVLENKNITLSNKNFGNKYDNSVRKVIFSEICENGNLLNKYAAFLSPSNEIFLFPLKSEDNSFIVSTNITKEAGAWKLIYLSTNKEIIGGVIDENYKVFVSNSIDFTITENFLNDTIEEPIIDPNLNIIYEQLEQTIIYLNSQDFINELLQNFELTEQNINQITTSLKNDETFKQEVKGDKGDIGPAGVDGNDGQNGADGKSSYQSWLDLGNVGTEDDFINSLKGDKGDKGDIGETGPAGSNGTDGFSPTITKSSITNGTRLTITDKTQTQTVDILNGTNYTITSSDYDAIANVVLTKMTNADNVSY